MMATLSYLYNYTFAQLYLAACCRDYQEEAAQLPCHDLTAPAFCFEETSVVKL